MTPPDMEELPDCWYVVDRGTEVGIFTDKSVSRPSYDFGVAH